MSATRVWGGTVRKIWFTETQKFRDHLLRLDAESRRMRFGMAVDEEFIKNYVAKTDHAESVIHGYFVGGEMRAAAELRRIDSGWGGNAEAAFSVERDYQDSGLGTELLGRVILVARNRGVKRIYMNCLSSNRRMLRVAKKFSAELFFDHGEVVAQVNPSLPTPFSLMSEAIDDGNALVMAVLDLPPDTNPPF
jgi:GNAT superfamily N-acetyltransferase